MRILVQTPYRYETILWPDNLRIPVVGDTIDLSDCCFTVNSIMWLVNYDDTQWPTGEVRVELRVS